MLIITADDFGLDNFTTDKIFLSSTTRRITCASAMVFMADSVRSAKISSELSIEIGLHLNFTLPFTQPNISPLLQKHHNAIRSYLLKSKFSQIIYNPVLRKSFDIVFRAQEEEFLRLYERHPAFYNGHHHMHLCANVIVRKYLPKAIPIRRTFTFSWGEKNPFNILYRRLLDYYINKMHISTSSLYSLSPLNNLEKLSYIFNISKIENVELMVHPNREEEFSFLQSTEFVQMTDSTRLGTFSELTKHIKKV